MLEFFQTAGAAVGFIGGAITLYDRLLRYRPHVSIYADLEGVKGRPWLRVTNRAPFDIFIDKIDIEPDDLIGLALGQTESAMVDVMTKERVIAVINPMGTAEFLIVQPDKFKSEKRPAERIKIKVHWYRRLPRWMRPFAATTETSINDIEERKRAVERARK